MFFCVLGDESEIQNFIPISPPQVFNAETGQLSLREENQLSPRRRKMKNKLSSASPLVFEGQEATDKDGSELGLQASEGSRSETLGNEELIGRQPEIGYARRQCDPGQENVKLALPGIHLKWVKIHSLNTPSDNPGKTV